MFSSPVKTIFGPDDPSSFIEEAEIFQLLMHNEWRKTTDEKRLQ